MLKENNSINFYKLKNSYQELANSNRRSLQMQRYKSIDKEIKAGERSPDMFQDFRIKRTNYQDNK